MLLNKVHNHIDRCFPVHLSKIQEFLRQPSISSEHVGLVETAQWLQAFIQTCGGQAQLVGNPEAPIVLARFDLGQPKTLLVYGMYDVQPVAGQKWSSLPFAADLRDLPTIGPSVIARGACNSKGPLMAFLNTLQAFRQVGEIPVNLILTIEGEEEIGSLTLPQFYRQNKEMLRADAGFEPFWATYGTDALHPTMSLGSKGVMGLELRCRGGDWGGPRTKAIHSSVGAWIASPTWRLIKALGTLLDADESIVIEDFYEEVVPPSPEDEKLLAQLSKSFDEQGFLESIGAQRFKHQLQGIDLLRRYIFSPTLGINSPVQAQGDVIDTEAHIELIIRLVPKMDPDHTADKIRRHLAAQGYGDIEVRILSAYPSSRTDIGEKVVQCMIETYRDHGVEPEIWPMLPSATPYFLFSEILGIPYVWGGLGEAGGSHVADEYASVEGLKLLEKSIATFLCKFALA